MNPEQMYSKSAESAVLGSMIIGQNRELIGKVRAILPTAEFFFMPENQIVYNAIMGLYLAGNPVDGLIVRDKLTELELQTIGGPEYLKSMLNSIPTTANVEYYASIILKKWQERKLFQVSDQIKNIIESDVAYDDKISNLQKAISCVSISQQKGEVYQANLISHEAIAKLSDDNHYLSTGYPDLDNYISGLSAGELYIIAARTGMGKSVLALCMALNVAQRHDSVLYVTLEMPVYRITQRAIAAYTHYSIPKRLDINATEGYYYDQYQQTCTNMAKFNDEVGSRMLFTMSITTPDELSAKIQEIKMRRKLSLVVVDYLQQMTSATKHQMREQEVSEISRKLKLMAIKEQVPVIAVSQLNRAVEGRENKRPRLADIRESGGIENDADVVMLVYRADYYRKMEGNYKELDGIGEIIIAKNRYNTEGVVQLVFHETQSRFENKENINNDKSE